MKRLLVVMALAGTSSSASAIGLTPLVALDSGTSATPACLSADGTIVGGWSFSGSAQTGTIWSGPGYATRQTVGLAPDHFSEVTGLSADGSVVAGVGEIGFQDRRGFVRTSGGSPAPIDGTSGALNNYAVSSDGQTVVGYYQPGTPDRLPARWRAATGMQVLSGLSARAGLTTCVSSNGSMVGGWLRTTNGSTEEAFVWSESSGPTILPKFNPSFPTSEAADMTPDGAFIVGTARPSSSVDAAVRWTRNGASWSLESLGFLPGTSFGFATSISANGTVVGGACGGGPGGEQGFIWTPGGGMMTINQYAASQGVDLSGWFFQRVMDLSADGRTLCCIGLQNNTAYGVVISVPCPGAPALACGLLAFAARRRRG